MSGALPGESLAYLHDHALSLLIDGLHRHEMHPRASRRLADRLGVVTIILAAFNVGFHVLGRHQEHGVAELLQFACPVMGAAACFLRDDRRRQLAEKRHHLRAPKIDAQDWPILMVDAMQREHGFGRVDAYALILGHGRLRFWLLTAQFWHLMPWGRPPQQCNLRATRLAEPVFRQRAKVWSAQYGAQRGPHRPTKRRVRPHRDGERFTDDRARDERHIGHACV